MMNEHRFSLCPNCDACPEVVMTDQAVVIGEEGNQVSLSAAEWNVLVAAVRQGQLGPIATKEAPAQDDCGCGCECEV